MAGDDRLFRRVALTTLVVTVIVFVALAAYFPWVVSINFALGVAAGLASLSALEWMVRQVTAGSAAGRRRRFWAAAALHLAKYGAIGVGLYLLLRSGYLRAPALAGGLIVPTAVLCLKSLGRDLNARLGVGKPEDQRK